MLFDHICFNSAATIEHAKAIVWMRGKTQLRKVRKMLRFFPFFFVVADSLCIGLPNVCEIVKNLLPSCYLTISEDKEGKHRAQIGQ